MNRIFKILLTISILSFVSGGNQYIRAQNKSGGGNSAQVSAQASVQASVQASIQALANDPALIQGIVGICARTLSGKEIVSVNADRMLIPASNMKLITTGAAMHALGPDYRFTTTLAYDGDIEEGVLHGNIYIIGGADPTLGSRDSIATPAETLFRQWEKMVRDAGISTVDGSIIGDGRYFEGAMEEVTWLWEDIGTYYGAGTCGLTFYENMISFSAAPGREIGDEVDMKPEYPETPWMEIRYKGTTAEAGTGDQLYMYTSELAPVAEIRGTLAMDKGRKRVDCSNKFPELTCATYFMRHLEKSGIRCLRGAGDFKLETGWMSRGEENRQSDTRCNEPVQITVGQTQSPILQSIAFETNHESNNVYAETLLRTMGVEFGGSSLYPQSISIMEQILGKGVHGCQGEENSFENSFEIEGLGIDMSKGIFIKDGSGLSRGNLVSPDFFCRFLAAMSKSPAFDGWLNGLPSPGGNGTLSYNMKKYPESVRKRIRMKSGSMNGVRCYSGYILPEGYIAEEGGCTTGEGGCITEEGGRTSKEGGCTTKEGGSPTGEGKGRNEDIIVFSVMVNNCTSPNWKVRPLIDKIIATIAME